MVRGELSYYNVQFQLFHQIIFYQQEDYYYYFNNLITVVINHMVVESKGSTLQTPKLANAQNLDSFHPHKSYYKICHLMLLLYLLDLPSEWCPRGFYMRILHASALHIYASQSTHHIPYRPLSLYLGENQSQEHLALGWGA